MITADCRPDEVCCDTVTTMQDQILDVVFAALESCCDTATCACFQRVVSVGDEPSIGGDYVAVWWTRTAAAPPSPRAQGLQLLPRFRFSYSIKFHETGWPTINARSERPPPDVVTAAARVHNSRVEVIMRGVLGAMRQNAWVKAGSFQSFDGHTPRPRDTGGVSDVIDITLEHDWLPSVTA